MSVKPFKKPAVEEKPRTLWQRITETSPAERKEVEGVIGQAKMFEEWTKHPYYQTHLNWLRAEADRPVGPNEDLIRGMTRANTFKEVITHLEQLRMRASVALGEING